MTRKPVYAEGFAGLQYQSAEALAKAGERIIGSEKT